MGFFLEFDEANNTVRLTFEGKVTAADIGGDAYAALQAFVSTRSPCKGIADFSKVTIVEAPNQLIQDRARAPAALPGGLPFVFVAPQDHLFGLSRMFTTLAETTRPHLKVVRAMSEAYNLLGVDSPNFVRVKNDRT